MKLKGDLPNSSLVHPIDKILIWHNPIKRELDDITRRIQLSSDLSSFNKRLQFIAEVGIFHRQERDRRRMWDREREQSMTLEQRERHLARRRRNYQLRRQRVKHLEYSYPLGPSEIASSGDASERNEKPREVCNRCMDIIPAGFDHVLQETDTAGSKYEDCFGSFYKRKSTSQRQVTRRSKLKSLQAAC